MVYKKFIKRGGKFFGPYYYESYRDNNGHVKKKYLGVVNPVDRKKRVDPTKNKVFKNVFLVPIIVLSIIVFGLMIYNSTTSEVMESSFESVEDFVSGSFFKIMGFVVSDVDEPEELISVEDSGGGDVEEAEEVEEVVEEVEEAEEVEEEELGEGSLDLGDEEIAEVLEEDSPEESFEELGSDEGVSEAVDEDLTNETIIDELVINETIVEVNETVELNETVLNESVGVINETVELNETFVNETVIDEIVVNETVELNETFVNESVLNESEIVAVVESLTTLQYNAVIHRSVRWLKKINVSVADNLTIEIPKLAENVSVLVNGEVGEAEKEIGDYKSLVDEIDKGKIVSGFLTGDVVKDIYSGKGFFTRLWDWIMGFRISGNVVFEDELEADGEIVEMADSKIVDVEGIVNKTNAEEIGVGYYTPAPFVVEENISGGKLVTVSADDVYNYTDVLAYSLIGEMGIPVNSSVGLKVYWRASYEDAVKYGYIEEDISKKDLKKEEKEKVPKGDNSNESKEKKEKKEKEEPVENETLEEVNETLIDAPIGHDPAGPENETLIDEIIINETVELNESDKKVKDEKEKGNKTIGNDKKILITGEVVGEVDGEGLVVEGIEEAEVVEEYVRVLVNFSVHDLDGDGFVDYVEWIVPHLSNQSYEISIEVLNVQSYPTVGGNWTVRFNTTGEANLTVSAFNGTTYGFEYSNESLVYDLEFLETRCGEEVLNVSVIMNETVVPYEIYLKKKRIEEIRRLLGDGE